LDKRLTSLYQSEQIVALHALGRFRHRGLSHVRRCSDMRHEPITIAEAASRLRKRERTVRTWASRYHGRRLAKSGKTAWYDWHDLKTIARQIHLGLPVPATPEARDAVRASLLAA
jgi:hypothetical protein